MTTESSGCASAGDDEATTIIPEPTEPKAATLGVKDERRLRRDAELNNLHEEWEEIAPDFLLDRGSQILLRSLLGRFSYEEVSAAMSISVSHYVYRQEKSASEAWEAVGGICYNRRQEKEKPEVTLFQHLRSILRKRFGVHGADDEKYSDECAFDNLDLALRRGIDLTTLEIPVRYAPTFQHFEHTIIERVRDHTALPKVPRDGYVDDTKEPLTNSDI